MASARGWEVTEEPHIRLDGQLLKPDLLMVTEDRVILCEVGVN